MLTPAAHQRTAKTCWGSCAKCPEASRTLNLPTLGYRQLVVALNFTHGAATYVQTQFLCSMDDGLTFHRLQTRSTAYGKSTLSDFTDVKAVSGSALWTQEYDVAACSRAKLIFSGAGVGANDKVTVQVTVTTR